MHFVHIVEINDPRSPLTGALTREQLWRGLVRRAEQPKEFLPQLNSCVIVLRGDRTLVRELQFGALVVRDRVRLEPMNRITFDTDAANNVAAGRLVIEIEEPSEGRMQLRFTYDTERERSTDEGAEQQYDRLLQSAYIQADVDSVKLILAMWAAGVL